MADDPFAHLYKTTDDSDPFAHLHAKPGGRSVAADIAIQAAQGFNRGLDSFYYLPNHIVNAIAQAAGYEPLLATPPLATRFNIGGTPEGEQPSTGAGRYAGAIGEQFGANVLPTGALMRAGLLAPKLLGHALASSGAGAGTEFAREHGAGPVGETIAGLAGAFSAPAVASALGRTGGAVSQGLKYGYEALTDNASEAAMKEAALRKATDKLLATGVTPADIRAEITPPKSANLSGRGFTDEDLADIISRGLRGEAATDIAKDYGLHPQTVRDYVSKYREQNPTPLNMLDVTAKIAGEGKAQPLARFGRAAMALTEDGTARQTLIDRQLDQPGRAVSILSTAQPGNYEATLDRLLTQAGAERRAFYKKLYSQPDVIVTPDSELAEILSQPLVRAQWEKARMLAESEGERIPTFEELGLTFGTRPRGGIGLTKQGELVQPEQIPDATPPDVNAVLLPVKALDYFQRSLRLSAKSAFNSDGTLGTALSNIRRRLFEVLDPANPSPTQQPLVPDFRGITTSVRGSYGGSEALEAGRNMVAKLGSSNARDTLAEYNQMSPTQRALFRLGFVENLSSKVGDPKYGTSAVAQFNSPNVHAMIRRIFPEREVPGIAEHLIDRLKTEGLTTRNANFLTTGGSRTAEMSNDMDNAMLAMRMAADTATGRWWKMLDHVQQRLAYQMGQKQAQYAAQAVTETTPSELLPMLNKMDRYAQTASARQNWLADVRAARSPWEMRPGPLLGAGIVPSGTAGNKDSDKPRSAREIVNSISPKAKVRYSPELGGLVVGD